MTIDWALTALDALFVVAAAAPVTLVLVYRMREVRERGDEIYRVVHAALAPSPGAEAPQKKAEDLLTGNPYISSPIETFARCHSISRYVLPTIVLTLVTASFVYIGRAWVANKLGTGVASPLARMDIVIVMALAGGYVWSLQQLVDRIGANELGPDDIREIDLGLLAAVPIGYAFSLITTETGHLREFVAFAASAFPVRDVSLMFRQYATRKMLEATGSQAAVRPAERHLGTAIEGLSDDTLARLAELRITTVLDMAYCDPIKILVQTGFPLPIVIDWIDQSIWALYAGELKTDMTRCGIRCSLDACEFVDLHLKNKDGSKKTSLDPKGTEALTAVAARFGVPASLIEDLFFRVYADPQVRVLRKLWYPGGTPGELDPPASS